MQRQLKKEVKIGNIKIGGTNPIAVQTMLNVPVKDIAGNVAQAERVAKAGCQIVRVTVPTPADAAVVAAIKEKVDIPVVMMAGGLGTRLYPYTKILPKPLIPVGEQPIAELIFSRFRDFGCRHMTMIVNYKRGMIKSYFADLEKDYTVDFIDEDVFMGTGGGLCLLKGRMDSPFFFTNCDTLLDLDYGDLYQYHKAHGNLVTMVCAFKHYVVPYGVVELGEDGGIAAMREKPELNFLTNTGVYVVEPRVVEEMKMGEVIGFPDVIDRYRAAGEKVGVYPINESSWMDMGQMEELEKMRRKLQQQS